MRKKTDEQFKVEVRNLVGNEYSIEGSYEGSHTKIQFHHSDCGNTFLMTPNDFLRGHHCPFCSGKMRKTDDRFKAEVRNLVGNEYAVEGTYQNNKTKIQLRHNSCGNTFLMKPNDFLYGRRCPECFGTPQKTTEQFKKEVLDLVGNEYAVEGTYQNNKTKIGVRHNTCGNTFFMTPSMFLQGNRCPKCFGTPKKTTEQFKKEVLDLVGDEYTVEGTYKDTHTKIQLRHNSCGNIFLMAPHSFLQGKRCPEYFGTPKKTTEQFKKEVLDLVGNEYSVIEPYENAHTKIQFRHNTCGNIFLMKSNDFLRGRRCPKCAKTTYLGEKAIQDYLETHNITFEHDVSIKKIFTEYLEYSMKNYHSFMKEFVDSIAALKDKTGFGKMIDQYHISRIRFDFYIFSDKNKKKLAGLIEYDGEQHFRFIQFFFKTLEKFLYRHTTDQAKNSFAEFLDIPLIRIAYFQKDQINAMLDDFFARPEYYRTQHNTYLTNEEYEACFDETDALADMKDFKFET